MLTLCLVTKTAERMGKLRMKKEMTGRSMLMENPIDLLAWKLSWKAQMKALSVEFVNSSSILLKLRH